MIQAVLDMDVMNLTLLEKLRKARRFFRSSEYLSILVKAEEYYLKGQEAKVFEELTKLPSEKELLDKLINKLKFKPVYKTLKKIARGEVLLVGQELKGWFSLGAHIAIEMEKGRAEYGLLLPLVYNKIGQLLKEMRVYDG